MLALRYLGPSKRGSGKMQIDEDQAKQEMVQLASILGAQAGPLPDHLKNMIRAAEQMKRTHKGVTP